jgi:hypothetical protein
VTASSGSSAAADGVRWHQPEVAWPLALAIGFVGTLLGVLSGLPGVALVLAVAPFAPLFASLARGGHATLASAVTAGWLIGVAAAASGLALDRGVAFVTPAAPLAGALLDRSGGLPLAAYAALLVTVLAARPTRGVLALAGLGLVTAAAGACAGRDALALVDEGWSELAAVIAAWGLSCTLPLGLLAVAVGPLLAPGPLWPPAAVDGPRRRVLAALLVSLPVLGTGLLERFADPEWRAAVRWVTELVS